MSGSAKAEITDADRASAEISSKKWNDFVGKYGPVQDNLLKITGDTNAARSRMMGEANAEAVTASGLSPAVVQKQMQTGSKTSSVNALGDVMERASAARRGLGAAYGTIDPAIQERAIRGKLKVVASTRGIADSANLGMSDIGTLATSAELARVQRATDMRQGLLGAAGTAAGAYSAYTLYGRSAPPSPKPAPSV